MTFARRLSLATRGLRGGGESITIEVPVEVEVEVIKNRYYSKEFSFEEDILSYAAEVSIDILDIAIQDISVDTTIESIKLDVEPSAVSADATITTAVPIKLNITQ